eukprot:2770737-Rhodomonas_salina.1
MATRASGVLQGWQTKVTGESCARERGQSECASECEGCCHGAPGCHVTSWNAEYCIALCPSAPTISCSSNHRAAEPPPDLAVLRTNSQSRILLLSRISLQTKTTPSYAPVPYSYHSTQRRLRVRSRPGLGSEECQ